MFNFGHAIPFSSSRNNIEVCERCPVSHSIEWHWSHDSIFLFTKVITKRKLILDMQLTFLPVGIKWKVVKGAHCQILLNGTGHMSLSSC